MIVARGMPKAVSMMPNSVTLDCGLDTNALVPIERWFSKWKNGKDEDANPAERDRWQASMFRPPRNGPPVVAACEKGLSVRTEGFRWLGLASS